ncbi:host attachment protein [Pseudokordiimonas caeni]|uniref:host attachment protein n=1 Tax=Pseudokordiimonas caeni TaxID=2997908 RepID=UPI0028128239|nr:host attachment protein [Pseudokordiimonas caeni]
MHSKPKREWIVLADAAHAKIYTRHYVDGALQQLWVMEHPEARAHQSEMGTDRPGHGHGSASHHRYAYEDHANFPEQESEHFLRSIASEVNRAAKHDEMDNIILIALPKTMATIKSEFNRHTLAKISGEYAKNLIGLPKEALDERIKALGSIAE